MAKKNKKFKIPFRYISSILLVIMGIAIFKFFILLTQSKENYYPYPYKIASEFPIPQENQNVPLTNTHVLIIGDRMGEELGQYSDHLKKALSKLISANINVSSYSFNNEGLHRTIARLKKLKTIPPVIVYHGASQEFYEKKINLIDYEKIKKNISTFKNGKIHTALQLLPFLKRIFYKKITQVNLKKTSLKNITEMKDLEFQQYLEIALKLYELELEELTSFIIENGKKLILTTTPVNLDVPAKNVCQLAITEDFLNKQKILEKQLNDGYNKKIINELLQLTVILPGNSKTLYMLGKAYQGAGNFQQARRYLKRGLAYDCQNNRAGPIQNAIITRIARKFELPFYQFEKKINQQWPSESPFRDEIFLREKFYKDSMEELAKIIAPTLIF